VIGDYRLDIDYSTCLVAIALYRHRVVVENIGTQISVEHLTAEVNLLPLSKSPNFNAYPLILKHGFHIPGACLNNVGISTNPIIAEDLYLAAFTGWSVAHAVAILHT
jgi:hypothetical protein